MLSNNKYGSNIKDVGLNANVRPGSINVIGHQPTLFPFDAFEFDDPNKTNSPTLSMANPWKIDIGEIALNQLSAETIELLEGASIVAEANSLSIQNVSGEVNIIGDTVNIIARELNLEGETINITADKLVIYNPSDDTDTETLNNVFEVSSGNVYINGNLYIESDDAFRTINVGDIGIKALDADNNVIHDLPDEPIVDGATYSGHLIYSDGSDTGNEIYHSTSVAYNTWTTVQAKTYDNTNVKAVLLKVFGQVVGSGTSGVGYGLKVSFRPTGSTWTASSTGGLAPSVGGYLMSVSAIHSLYSQEGIIIVPVDSNCQFDYTFYNVGSSSLSRELDIVQLGVFI